MKLSNREFRVLKLVFVGKNNKQISDIMYISVDTVKAHITSIMRKLGANNRTEAVYFALRLKILTLDMIDDEY